METNITVDEITRLLCSRVDGRVRALVNGGTMFDGLTWNEFGGYYEGDSWAARGDAIERQQRR